MGYQGLNNGLYRVWQRSGKFGGMVKHHGVIDIGNALSHPNVPRYSIPVVYHLITSGISIEFLSDSWHIIGKIEDEIGARHRLEEALKIPDYHLLWNNCEHFSNFIATGERRSPQLVNATVITGIAALAVYAMNGSNDDESFF